MSIEIGQDLTSKTVELKQKQYWDKAVERFAEFLPKDRANKRKVPLLAADERMLTEPTEEEVKEAEHLPFPNLLGVVQYKCIYQAGDAIRDVRPFCQRAVRTGEYYTRLASTGLW